MMGMKMPPARAVVDGIAGAIRVSAIDSPYASPRVLLQLNSLNSSLFFSSSPWSGFLQSFPGLTLPYCVHLCFVKSSIFQSRYLEPKSQGLAGRPAAELHKDVGHPFAQARLLEALQGFPAVCDSTSVMRHTLLGAYADILS